MVILIFQSRKSTSGERKIEGFGDAMGYHESRSMGDSRSVTETMAQEDIYDGVAS